MTRRLLVLVMVCVATWPGGRASALPAACANPCDVDASGESYLPPATTIASGTTMIWTSASKSHPTSNTTNPDEICFSVSVGVNTTPAVRFDLVGGQLYATAGPGTDDEETLPCTTGLTLPTGDVVLPYYCLLHAWMKGAVVVAPA